MTKPFGFQDVKAKAKPKMVSNLFSKVATRYDLMNDIMSFGLHRLWKQHLVYKLKPRPNKKLLDLAGGTGDISKLFLKEGGGQALVLDLTYEMLKVGILDSKNENKSNQTMPSLVHQDDMFEKKLSWICGDCESLPIKDNYFNTAVISFGLRNTTHIDKVITEVYRTLKFGGKFFILEFSTPSNSLISSLHDQYLFKVVPKMGRIFAGDESSYRYLSESIVRFESKEIVLSTMRDAGFVKVSCEELLFGTVVLYQGLRAK